MTACPKRSRNLLVGAVKRKPARIRNFFALRTCSLPLLNEVGMSQQRSSDLDRSPPPPPPPPLPAPSQPLRRPNLTPPPPPVSSPLQDLIHANEAYQLTIALKEEQLKATAITLGEWREIRDRNITGQRLDRQNALLNAARERRDDLVKIKQSFPCPRCPLIEQRMVDHQQNLMVAARATQQQHSSTTKN